MLQRKKDGSDYEPTSLRGISFSMDRKLRRHRYGHYIGGDEKHTKFPPTKETLKTKMKLLSQFFINIFNVHSTIDSVFEVVDEIIFSIRHLKILIFGFEWRYPKLSTFSIHFVPNCHPLLEITDIPVNFCRHNRKVLMTQMKSDCWMMSYKPSRFLNRQRVYCV